MNVPVVWKFKKDGEVIRFLPLVRTWNIKTQEYGWIGMRIDKSSNPRDFLRDICRSIDKRDLKRYDDYVYTDIWVEVSEEDIIKVEAK